MTVSTHFPNRIRSADHKRVRPCNRLAWEAELGEEELEVVLVHEAGLGEEDAATTSPVKPVAQSLQTTLRALVGGCDSYNTKWE